MQEIVFFISFVVFLFLMSSVFFAYVVISLFEKLVSLYFIERSEDDNKKMD